MVLFGADGELAAALARSRVTQAAPLVADLLEDYSGCRVGPSGCAAFGICPRSQAHRARPVPWSTKPASTGRYRSRRRTPRRSCLRAGDERGRARERRCARASSSAARCCGSASVLASRPAVTPLRPQAQARRQPGPRTARLRSTRRVRPRSELGRDRAARRQYRMGAAPAVKCLTVEAARSCRRPRSIRLPIDPFRVIDLHPCGEPGERLWRSH